PWTTRRAARPRLRRRAGAVRRGARRPRRGRLAARRHARCRAARGRGGAGMNLPRRLDRLADLASRAREIGLDAAADEATAVVERARARAGFPGEAYVLALAGGTGVGKSSLLNALAGRTVSAVRAVRPTTDEPMAWVADRRRGELAPLFAWLGVEHVATHADEALADVAILDLPDVDSVRTEHRQLVDRLLPRIDAIAWVVDPEKYD